MRLKNIKGAADKIEQSNDVIKEPKTHIGKFQKLFANANPIHIEIGMGKGNFIIENAKRYPEINFIGIERYDSVIVRAVEKLEQSIPNLRLIRMDATEIEEVFNQEIDCIYLNFSDPWPKDRHYKRRLSSPVFLNKYDKICKGLPHIVMKTDNRKLFEYSVLSFTEYGYHINDMSLDLYQDDISANIQTEYEEKFHGMGFPIYYIDVVKKKVDKD